MHQRATTRADGSTDPRTVRAAFGRASHLILRGAALAGLVLVSFGAGYIVHGGAEPPTQIELDDYVVSNVVHELAYAAHLRNGRYDTLSTLIDIRLNDHLDRVREAKTADTDRPLALARMRTLVDVADWWAAHPPMVPASMHKESWVGEWETSHRANLALVAAAKDECDRTACKPTGASLAWVETLPLVSGDAVAGGRMQAWGAPR